MGKEEGGRREKMEKKRGLVKEKERKERKKKGKRGEKTMFY